MENREESKANTWLVQTKLLVIESHRDGVPGEVRGASGGAWPPAGRPAAGGRGGVRVQPRSRVHVAGAAEEDGAHVQEDQADGVVCGEVAAFVEKGCLKKIAGVKTRELMLWLSVVEVYVQESAAGKVMFKTGTGLSDTFDAAAFALGE